ncbi:unnamed protein product [Cylicocyclus nassatus]|uniref:Topo IIA-type catalytic domain-containing protein n=1 Tax=Cylicocyclus nassatus TaxID=53992 RepID=A0AA36HIJ3_CYLNA|nr:unnamed protein product [Cylicocyclus nassatus]
MGVGDTIARMCQTFANNIPLISATGNAGNVTSGDDAAAPRYLDVLMPQFTKDILFDEFDGIGYTLSSDVPPYNLAEVADATIKLLKNPSAKVNLVPDLPTGCDIIVVDDETFVMQSSYEIDNDGPNPIKEILSADDESDLLNNDFRYIIRCKRIQTSDLNKVSSVDAAGQFIIKGDNETMGMFYVNSRKPYILYVTRLGRIRLNHSKFLTTGKKFGDPKPIIKLSPQDDLVAVFCVDKDQSVTLNHADSRVSTINIDSLNVSTMALPPERPKHVPGVKVIRATIS